MTSVLRAALASGLILANISVVHAGRTDTPEDVMRAAGKAADDLKPMEEGLKVALAIASRMQQREIAVQVLALAKKNDRKGITELLKTDKPTIEKIRVTSIKDFYLSISIAVGGKTYQLCIGDHCRHPSGAKSPVVFTESPS
jgi:hypothetical protein